MGKIANYITFVSMLGYFVCCKPVSSNRNISHNVISRDTVVEIVETIDTVFEEIDIRQAVLDTLGYYIGAKELTGNNDGPIIEMFLEAANRNPKGKEPWCAAFITYGFKANDLEVPNLPALSSAWFDTTHTIPNEEAIEADLAGFYYKNLGRIGHIAAYRKPFVNETPYVLTREGNTNAQGSREGNQVSDRLRLRATVYKSSDWIGKN